MSNANDPIELLLNFSIASSPSGIETQEAQGQQNLVHSDALPIQGDWEVLKRWGVIQGEPIDKLFCSCTLPSDWKKVATNHSMWSNLLDSRGFNPREHILQSRVFTIATRIFLQLKGSAWQVSTKMLKTGCTANIIKSPITD
ncbi:MAG: hypothetical protein HC941_30290 [Microcoleus sp. SU_5_3]|nr:hypothetical protein [Microcoleus sp. SU_5_3]